jgi:hypothetical protein
VVFVLTGCDLFSMPMPMPDPEQPPGFPRGEIAFAYLNAANRLAYNDTAGRMAMIVANLHITPSLSSPSVLIVAAIPGNNPANGVTVDVKTDFLPWISRTSSFQMHYADGKAFPHTITIIFGRETPSVGFATFTGTFSTFNYLTQTYSVTFSSCTGAKVSFSNLILNSQVFELHEEEYQGLTNTQNIRLNRIMTTLAIWSSLQQQIAANHEEDANSVQNMVVRALSNASFTAAVALSIPSAPEAIITPDVAIAPAPEIITRLYAAYGAISPLARNSQASWLLPPPPPRPPAPSGPLPEITVALDGTPVENNSAYPFLPEIGESFTFQIAVTNLQGLDYRNIIDMEYLFFLFEPRMQEFGGMLSPSLANAIFFDFEASPFSDGIVHLTITRRNMDWFVYQGIVQIVIRFAQFVKINGNASGYVWDGAGPWDREALTEAEGGYLFILNFSSRLPGV